MAAEGSDDISRCMLFLLADMASKLAVINDRAAAIYAEIKALAKTDADMKRLTEIPGVGPTFATALVAALGTGNSFGKGRDLATWLGPVPRQITTGGKAKLIGISKHGNRYLRKLFIHGARTVLQLVRDWGVAHNCLGRQLERASACECRGGCHVQQDGTYRLGCVDEG